MITCECGYVYHPAPGEKSLASLTCPKCKRKMKKTETWIMHLGDMTGIEARDHKGHDAQYLKQRRLKHGY